MEGVSGNVRTPMEHFCHDIEKSKPVRDLKANNLVPAGKRKSWLLIFGSILLVLGVGVLQGVMFQSGRALFFGDDAVGKIISADVGRSGKSSPKIRFQSRDGTEVFFFANELRNKVIGREVPVRYATGDPSVAFVGDRQSLYGSLALGGVFCCLMFLVGGFCIWEARRSM